MILKEKTQTSSDSEKEVPKTKLALEEKYKEQDKLEQSNRDDETNVDSVIDELPEPYGWRLLLLPTCTQQRRSQFSSSHTDEH